MLPPGGENYSDRYLPTPQKIRATTFLGLLRCMRMESGREMGVDTIQWLRISGTHTTNGPAPAPLRQTSRRYSRRLASEVPHFPRRYRPVYESRARGGAPDAVPLPWVQHPSPRDSTPVSGARSRGDSERHREGNLDT